MQRTAIAPAAPASPALRKADQVAEDLLVRIVRGEHAVGSVLATEDELAEQYGVNRGVVREAIKLLEVHGLVRPIRRRGTVVLDPLGSLSPRVLRAMLTPGEGRVDRGVLASLLEIRTVLDVEMTLLAARRRSSADLAELTSAVVLLKSSVGNQAGYSHAMGRFTRALARSSGNVLFEMLASWHQSVTVDLEPLFSTTRQATPEHAESMARLVKLIRIRDEAALRKEVLRFHAWATPRLHTAAALLSGDPLPRPTRKKLH